MTEVTVDKDFDNLTMTLVARFDAAVERVWELWADPRQLERWWGPPGYPATFTEHDLAPGEMVRYHMTAPDGQRHHGWWRIESVDRPRTLTFVDGFADAAGDPAEGMPESTVRVTLTAHEDGTRMEIRSSYASRDHMQQILDMGTAEGMTQAVEQIEEVLTA